MAKRVQVVLNEDVLSLGKSGDLVEVAPGYARNFLLPTGKGLSVTPAVLRQVEHRRAKEAERQAALKAAAVAFRTALDTIGRFTIKKQTGGDDVLFGTVTNVDVAEAIEAAARAFAEELGCKLGLVAQPLRAALTGSTVSPPIFEVAELLGKAETLLRVRSL